MHITKLQSFEEYIDHQQTNTQNNQFLRNIETEIQNKLESNEKFFLGAFSWKAQEESQILKELKSVSIKDANILLYWSEKMPFLVTTIH